MKIEDEIKGLFRNEYHKGAINLIYTVKQFNYQFLQLMKKHGLTEPQYNILKVMRAYQSEKSISIGFIKERMLDKSSDVSRLIDRLLKKGYVNRKESAVDRRQKEILLTQKGLELLSTLDECERKTDTFLNKLGLS